jgi:hypothetical protein
MKLKECGLYLMLLCPLLGDQITQPVPTVEQAREILRTTQPDRMNIAAASVIKSPENLKRQKTFDDQWAAILRLAADPKSGTADDVKVLIPYLGYGTGGAYIVTLREKGLAELKSTYPAFAAILANPAARSTLSSYCLDEKNRVSDRITAFVVLRYVDLAEFKRITPTVNDGFKNNSAALKRVLNDVENHRTEFSGDVWVQK